MPAATPTHDTLILGAGAAGLFAAPYAAAAGGRVLVIDHARRPGEKIRISGGGRCNFTNLHMRAENFLSQNPHFVKSALARFTPEDFLALLARHDIGWHEKAQGQLFCNDKASRITDMLLAEMRAAGAELALSTSIGRVSHEGGLYHVETSAGHYRARNLVVATGGKSIPKMGATGLAHDIARQFGIRVVTPRPGLVPLTFPDRRFAPLSGLSLPVRVHNARASFTDAMLFTHRGLSGPAILQISSCWQPGEAIEIDLAPDTGAGGDLAARLRARRQRHGRRALKTELAALLPARLVDHLAAGTLGLDLTGLDLAGRLADASDKRLAALARALHRWRLTPAGSEGWRTAEVTVGGVDTAALESSTMQARARPGLYFIGEGVDVTGWLGGYNFHWAWASAAAAGRAIAAAG